MQANVFVIMYRPVQTKNEIEVCKHVSQCAKNEIEVCKHTSQCACPLDCIIGMGTCRIPAPYAIWLIRSAI